MFKKIALALTVVFVVGGCATTTPSNYKKEEMQNEAQDIRGETRDIKEDLIR